MTDKIIISLLINTAVFSVLFCAMLLLRKTIGKSISPVLMLAMWSVVLIKLIIPFGFESGFSILPAAAVTDNQPYENTQAADGNVDTETDNVTPVDYGINAPVQPEQNTAVNGNVNADKFQSANNIDWTVFALCIWGAGAVTAGAVLCLSAANLKKRIRHARADMPQYIPELAEECKKELGIRRNISIIVQSVLDKPVIMRAIKPLLVLPENAEQLEREALKHIFLHELTHFKGGDLLAIKFMNVLRALYWFNPLVWICFKLIREDIEIACDQRVIKALGPGHRLKYIETVLSFTGCKSSDRFAAAMGLFDGRPAMERRIKGMFGKTRTDIKGRITAGLIAVLILAVSVLTACQPAAAGIAMNSERTKSSWEYSKEYSLGRSLNVDAAVYSVEAENLPTLTVVPKPFESGEEIKAITKLFCPDTKIYDLGGAPEPKFPIAPGSLKDASYKLVRVEDYTEQANMVTESDGFLSYINFANWDSVFDEESEFYKSANSDFIYESDLFISDNSGTKDSLVTPESLNGDSEYVKAKEKAGGYVKGMGIDYMSLNSVSRGEGSYSFYYTRTYNGLPETYVQSHTGTSVTGVDGAPSISLWNAEYLYIVIQNGIVVKARWENPSEIKSVDNESSKMLPWEQIKQIFLSAMDDMMTLKPYEKAAGTNAYSSPEGTEVVINRVELGYTKLLTKGTTDDYKLIPTWMFMGYETSPSYPEQEGVNTGAETCYITINAIDGTVIDRGQGL